ncbi:diencephalon/mesencephalon homeobox protein 1-like [Sarcophilus harrisii]|uniref:diencephalon/mesencephalon homeobox protein 1-like n=1 Tax=Sarcophilus harrisii TaxID=9305 RepID=UPI001301EE8D|nr:diencephalon/mesencephalon homeobox protein 1-like [Sarcophilus harrisii]
MANNSSPEEKKLDSFDSSSELRRRRKRSVFTIEQIHILKKYFKKNSYPGFEEREKLSKLTNIPEDRIHVWFHNRRARQSLQQKNRAPECSISLSLDEVPSGPILEEDFSKPELSTLSTFRHPSQADKPIQEAGPRSGCSHERSATSTTEPICSYGYGIPQRNPFFSFQIMGPSNEFQLCDLSRSNFQGRSNQGSSSWSLKGTQGSENPNTPNSFYGGVKAPLHFQKQDWATTLLYSNRSTIAFPGYRESASTSAAATTPPTELSQQSHPHQLSSLKLMPQHPCATEPCLSGTTSHLISTSVTGASNSDTDTIIIKKEEQNCESFCS